MKLLYNMHMIKYNYPKTTITYNFGDVFDHFLHIFISAMFLHAD